MAARVQPIASTHSNVPENGFDKVIPTFGGIRKVKIKMKNSGTFRSDAGADAFLDLLSIVETTKKHNNSPYLAIRALF